MVRKYGVLLVVVGVLGLMLGLGLMQRPCVEADCDQPVGGWEAAMATLYQQLKAIVSICRILAAKMIHWPPVFSLVAIYCWLEGVAGDEGWACLTMLIRCVNGTANKSHYIVRL